MVTEYLSLQFISQIF